MNPPPHRPDRAIELVKPLLGELVTPFIRSVCAAISVAYVLLGWAPLLDATSGAYDRPIFDAVFRLADPRVWGAVFMVCAAALLLTAITGRAGLYLVAVVGSTIALGAWASTIIYVAIVDEQAELTLGAGGLYVLAFTALIGLAMSPRQLVTDDRVIARLEHTDDNVVELRDVTRTA